MAEEAIETDEDWGEVKASPVKDKKPTIEYEIEGEEETQLAVEEEVEKEASKETQTELDGIETKGAQKRIRQLIKQRKDRDDRIYELEKRVNEYDNKLKQKDNEIVNTYKKTLDSNESQLKDQMMLAESSYRKALEGGDPDEIVNSQRQLNRSELQLDTLNKAKNAYQEYATQQPTQQEQVQQPKPYIQERPLAPNPAQYDPKAIQWATENEWFGQDQIMTAAAIAIDEQLKSEGYDPSDDEFYGEIDSRLKNSFPNKFSNRDSQKTEVREPEHPSQVVSGASRTVANPKTTRANKVKLTRDDIEMARRWGIPLERYAEQKLVADKAEGEYTTIITSKRGG